jgi:hypothetical protein
MYATPDRGVYQDDAATTPATANNDPVAYLRDYSGSHDPLYMSTTTRRASLQLNAINGYPSLRFDGVDDALAATLAFGRFNSIFYVGRIDGAPVARCLGARSNTYALGFQGTYMDRYLVENWVYQGTTPAVTNHWYQFTSVASPTAQIMYRDGAISASGGITNSNGPSGIALGGNYVSSNEYANCEVAAVIGYGRVLSTSEREAVEAFLRDRFGL